MGGLASHSHKRLYTLGVNGDRRRRIGMERERKMAIKRVSPI